MKEFVDNEKYVEDLIGKELLVGLKNNRKLMLLRDVLSFNKDTNKLFSTETLST